MLAAIRNFARSWVVKVLLGLLIISFAIWGVGDMFGGSSSGVVARIGDEVVTAEELDDAFRRRLQQVQQQSPQPVTRADAIRFGLLDDTLQTLIAQRLIDAEAARLGVTTADVTVGRLIMAEPAFRTDGSFDRERFQAILRQSGMDEERYTEDLRAEQTRSALVGAIRPIGTLPEALTQPIAERVGEARSGRLLVAVDQEPATIDAPDDATLEAFLEENQARFQAPERRDFTAVLLSPDLIAGEITPDEAELREAYEARPDRWTLDERRRVRQLRGADEADLRTAYEALRAGETADEVAARIDGVAVSPLGLVEASGLPEAFAAPIFSAGGVGSITPPVESAFGWHVFLIDEVVPPTTRPFAEVRDELAAELARERAAEELPALAVALDDEIGGGVPLEEAADRLALPLVQVTGIDRAGQDASGEPVAALEGWGPLLTEVFAADEGEVSLLEEIGEGRSFVFRIDAIRPAHPQTLDEAREAVLAEWRAEEARRRAEERATAALEDLQGGMSEADVVATHGLEERAIEGQTRTDELAPPAVVEALFAAEPGSAAAEPVDVEDGAAIVMVDAATTVVDEVVELTLAELENAFARDILVQYEAALRVRHPISVDRQALQTFFPTDG
ncbi:MAG: SurA N-terminal domain-containing protein [Pseudomonadota bacterium]